MRRGWVGAGLDGWQAALAGEGAGWQMTPAYSGDPPSTPDNIQRWEMAGLAEGDYHLEGDSHLHARPRGGINFNRSGRTISH